MDGDLNNYTARLRTHHHRELAPQPPAAVVLVVGYRACFAAAPKPGTPVIAFAAITAATTTAVAAPMMALISVENATQVVRVRSDGSSEIDWEEDPFEIFGHSGIRWCLMPVQSAPGGRFVIAPGSWVAGRYQAVLTRSTLSHAPTAPTVVAVHNADPHTGHTRW
ncbi:hypothetical protein GFY24_29670 [Nocardia sp. SYP-A9097]|uniref:hypothetical protein n=1 Tax=Nocardia sp. SYP-A9097 TaxID=2663237 RepID=UPI00129BC1E4|nr:hypothetical protein [Nocardia sp. SYP-A9097]MRH91560.1 hypothetical protein [Nocardia sp. SYP-A9097]